jgi:hypothetical protein
VTQSRRTNVRITLEVGRQFFSTVVPVEHHADDSAARVAEMALELADWVRCWGTAGEDKQA